MAEHLSPLQFQSMIERNEVVALDVRTEGEHRYEYIPNSQCMPMDRIDAQQVKTICGEKRAALYCQSGGRTETVLKKLESQGICGIVALKGGLNEWKRSGLPVEQGTGAISIERQARIVAGSLVLLGIVLGLILHPGFTYLSGFIGAGLVFAGITNTCGLAVLLSKMPWNR